MIEYGVPILFFLVVFVGVPVALLVSVFLLAKHVTRWAIRRGIRFAVAERIRAERDYASR